MPNKPQPPDIPTSPDDSSLSAGIPESINADNAMENSTEFRRALNDAWEKTSQASRMGQHREDAFTVERSGKTANRQTATKQQGQGGGEMAQNYDSDSSALVHTHPFGSDTEGPRPSAADVAAAKKSGRPVMVASREGLFEIAPGTGSVTQVSTDTSFKPSGEFRNASYSMVKDKSKKS
jgi:hypothetical protein